MRLEIRLGARDEESTRQMQAMQASEVDITPIHDVDRASFRSQQIQCMYIVQLAVGDMDKTGDAATQVEQGVHLDCRLGGSKVRPRKHRQTEIDGGRIEGIHRVRQFQAQVLAGVERSRLDDQASSEIGIDAPVARFVGIGQRRAPHRLAKSHVVQLGGLRRKTDLDVAQTFPVSELGKRHDAKLFGASQGANALVAAVTRNVSVECRPRQKIHQLGKQCLASIHDRTLQKNSKGHFSPISNRHHALSLGKPCQSWRLAVRALI